MEAVVRRAKKIQTVEDARRLAQRRLPPPVYDYIAGGAGEEVTVAENRQAFLSLRWRPDQGTAVGTEPRVLTCEVAGASLEMPILVGPVGFTRSMHPDGDVGGARAATKAGTVFCQSTMSGHRLEAVAETGGTNWFQLYKLGGREGSEQLLERAWAAGMRVLVVTIDTPVPGNRERDLAYGAALPIRINRQTMVKMAPYVAAHPGWLLDAARDHFQFPLASVEGLSHGGKPLSEDAALLHWIIEPFVWEDLAWIRAAWPGRILVKGVLGAAEARRALELGAEGLVVSNHGGRQLDQVGSTLEALVEVVGAVGDDTEVLVDGGIRRGSDVALALCLGAKAVLLGRAWVYGLAAAGELGVTRILDLLRADLERTMRLVGARTLDELDRSKVHLPSGFGGTP